MSCSIAVSGDTPDLEFVRELVRESDFPVGLVALSDRTFLELSPAAAALIGLEDSGGQPVDISVIAADHELVVSMRFVTHGEDQPYAIALFTNAVVDAPPPPQPTIESLLGPLREVSEPRRAGRVREIRLVREAVPGLEELTERQREILTLLLDGDRVVTISRRMHLSASTIRNHLSALYRKVGVHSQAELIERVHASVG